MNIAEVNYIIILLFAHCSRQCETLNDIQK